MDSDKFFSIHAFCESHGITDCYLFELKEFGLIEIENEEYLHQNMLPKVEKIIRFHKEMHINFEGIEVILNLLQKVEDMNRQMISLENRLRLFEES